jgi:hypothetical protein
MPNRFLLKEGVVLKMASSFAVNCTIYLFSDVLVYAHRSLKSFSLLRYKGTVRIYPSHPSSLSLSFLPSHQPLAHLLADQPRHLLCHQHPRFRRYVMSGLSPSSSPLHLSLLLQEQGEEVTTQLCLTSRVCALCRDEECFPDGGCL